MNKAFPLNEHYANALPAACGFDLEWGSQKINL